MKTRLVSFADGMFKPRAAAFVREAESIGVFDEIAVYELASMPAEFKTQHSGFIADHPRGFGYWLWKPFVILEEMAKSDPDDIVVYADVGFRINAEPQARDRMLDYFAVTSASAFAMLSFSNVHTEYRWTKASLAHRLNVASDPTIMATSQIAAGLLLCKPTTNNISLLTEWAKLSCENGYHYLDDSPSTLPNHPEFCEHRHDASIGSLLRKKRGTSLTFFEVQSYEWAWEKFKNSLPLHADRLRA